MLVHSLNIILELIAQTCETQSIFPGRKLFKVLKFYFQPKKVCNMFKQLIIFLFKMGLF